MDDGIYQLRKNMDTKAVNMKNFSPTFRALEGYDVEKLYVEKESMEARGLSVDDLVVPVEVLSSSELKELMDKQEVILTA